MNDGYFILKRLNIEIGTVYGKLTVVKEGGARILPSGQINRTLLCVCECGNLKEIRVMHLTREKITSCGCLSKFKNGKSSTKLYRVLKGMIERCDGKTKNSKCYFLKGITVCDEWKNDFTAFINWAESNGYREGLQIDRIDNSKGYFPENCRWVTCKVNANNKDTTLFVTYKNEKIALKLLLERKNRDNDYYTIRRRLKRNWTADDAIDVPIREGNYKRNTQKKS